MVNRLTHSYDGCVPASVRGWRRAWVSSSRRGRSFLSVVPAPDSVLHGLIAVVPGNDWAALDEREHAYFRSEVQAGTLTCDLAQPPFVQIYQANPDFIDPTDSRKPILLSYIDVVVQGYLNVFGEEGVEAFFATTQGWDTPILDDRGQPVYARPQQLSLAETALVDRHLSRLSAQVVQADPAPQRGLKNTTALS